MASSQINPLNFPFFSSPPPSHPWSPPHLFSPPPPHHFTPPPPPHHFTPPPPPGHPFSPPPPPPGHPMSPPPHRFSPPPPHHFPPPPHHYPPPPPPSPHHHPTVIVIVFISLGSAFFLACMGAFICCYVNKRRKMPKETEIIHFDDHRKVQEVIIPGPHGEPQAVVLSVEDDMHIDEEVKKNEKFGHVHGTHKNLDAGAFFSERPENLQLEHKA